MNIFGTLAVEITAQCNRRCVFCPVSTGSRPDEVLPLSSVRLMAHELAAMRYTGRVELYIYNEPLKNRGHLIECVKVFRSVVPKAALMLSTNGDYLKGEDDLLGLFALGIRQVVVNAYAPKRVAPLSAWVDGVRARTGAGTNVYGRLRANEVGLKFYDKSDVSAFGAGVFSLQNRAGGIPGFLPPTAEPLVRSCTKPFRMLNVNWRGEGMVCCNDYNADVPLGVFPENTLLDMWEGEVMTAYRRRLVAKDRTLPLCRVCDCHAGAYPGNIREDAGAKAMPAAQVEALYAARLAARKA